MNGNWLVDELADSPSSSSCGFACSSGAISGPGLLCNTSNFSVPAEAGNVTWSLSPANAGTINQTGPVTMSVTRAPGYQGNVRVTAQINSESCGGAEIHKDVHFGNPEINGSTAIQGPAHLNDTQAGTFYISTTFVEHASSYDWVVISYDFPGANQYFTINNFNNGTAIITPNLDVPDGTYFAQLRITNACGYIPMERSFTVTNEIDQIYFSAFPNPSNGQLNIALKDPNLTKSSSKSSLNTSSPLGETVTVQLFNMQGVLIKQASFKSSELEKQQALFFDRVKNDIYTMRISSGSISEVHRIIIQK